MIQSIIGTNDVHVLNSCSGPYISGNISDLGPGTIGELRLMGNTTYVWVNGYWTPVFSVSSTIELSPEIQSVLCWARIAMKREEELDKLIQEYPAVKTAKETLDIVVALTKDHSKN